MSKGILFDVDDTLWDPAVQVAESWDEVLTRYPHSGVRITTQNMCDSMGKTIMNIGKTLFPGLTQEEYRKVMEGCMTYKNHYLPTYPGVPYPKAGETMAHLSRQYRLYIVNNCQSEYVEMLLESCSLRGYVRDIECHGNTGLPEGDNIRVVVRRNHLERCFYADDTYMNEEAAGAAGIPSVHASYGFGRAGRPIDTIESLSRLPALTKKFLNQEQDMNQGECKEIKQVLELFLNESLERVLMSSPTDSNMISKFRICPLFMKGRLVFQAEGQAGKRAFRHNLDKDEVADYVTGLLEGSFRQAEITSGLGRALILVSKEGRMAVRMERYPESVRIQSAGEPGLPGSLLHNRKRYYILEEGTPAPFLVDLGVMIKEDRVVNNRYDKYRQINRFLEFIEDTLSNLGQGWEPVTIDLGCGKSYFTFTVYYYLKELKGHPVRITGLNLREGVIEHCNCLGRQYGYNGLSFCRGDIASFGGVGKVDMVVTLHACDPVTDCTLEKAANQGARIILSAPRCQHELNRQMENSLLRLVLQYGLIKGRMAALHTDAIRAQVLEYRKYRTQILEFIDMEHTPKNILIQTVHQGRKRDSGLRIRELVEFLHVRPMMVELLALGLWRPREKTTDIRE